ncbi:hypothetical protein RRSWK_06240 [Rhodopirellula sp. SWK7]|nr:hypothetical protein RRSWK_06240 [Rhodopirellula sp. SWK7]
MQQTLTTRTALAVDAAGEACDVEVEIDTRVDTLTLSLSRDAIKSFGRTIRRLLFDVPSSLNWSQWSNAQRASPNDFRTATP